MKTNDIFRRTTVVTILGSLALVMAFSIVPVVFGDPSPTPNGFCGGLNMVEDPTMLTVAMVKAAPQGIAGMFTAVAASNCS